MKNIFFILVLTFFFLSCENNSIPPGFSPDHALKTMSFTRKARVETRQVTNFYKAVGTIRPLTESRIESQVTGQVLSVNVVPGTRVKAGDVLVLLDSRQLNAREKQAKEGLAYAKNLVSQAKKALDEAQAGLEQANAAYLRTKTLFDKDVVPSQQLEIDRAAFLQARARKERAKEGVGAARSSIRQAEEVVKEAGIALGYARITAPAGGVVVERLIDPGDIALPGKPLLLVQTSGSLRLEARIREGLIKKIIQGRAYGVEIDTQGEAVKAAIEEIVPYADPETRTFLVKAALPDMPGIYPGMFGRLLIPVEEENTLLIPEAAVTRVGQLEMVNILDGDDPSTGYRSVYIKTGKRFGTEIEVLSGLIGNETLGY